MSEIRTSTEFILEHLPVPPQKSCVTLKSTQTNPDAKLDSFAYFVIVFLSDHPSNNSRATLFLPAPAYLLIMPFSI